MTILPGMYNFNMYGNSMGMMFQQGLGMFGGGLGGSGIFTNCWGEVNYDAMAGYGVANALLGVAGQAISSTRAQKQEAKAEYQNNKADIDNIYEEITSKRNEKTNLSEENNTKQNEINTANNTIGDLESQIKDLDIDSKKSAYETAGKEDPKPENYDDLKNAYDEAVRKKTELEGQIKNQKELIESNKKIIENNNTKITTIDEQIKKLEEKKEKLQEAVNNVDLDKADGKKFQRTKKEDFDAKWKEDGTMADNVEFSKGDMRYAIAGFRNATSDDDKKYWANKIATIYKNMNQSDITSDFKTARKIVDSYVD